MVGTIARHIGNRGAVLIILGFLWVLTAIGIATNPIISTGRQLLPYEHLPVWFRVTLWAAPGLFAIAAAVRRNWDDNAWMLLIVPVAERTLSFLWVWIVDLFIGGWPTAWRGFLIYAATGTLIYFCARGLDRPAPWDGRDRRRA